MEIYLETVFFLSYIKAKWVSAYAIKRQNSRSCSVLAKRMVVASLQKKKIKIQTSVSCGRSIHHDM